MMDSQPDRRCRPPQLLFAGRIQGVSLSVFLFQRRRRVTSIAWVLMKSSARQCLNDFWEWDDGIKTFRRLRIKRFVICSNKRGTNTPQWKNKRWPILHKARELW